MCEGRRETDEDRDPPAPQDAAEDVAAEIVDAHEVAVTMPTQPRTRTQGVRIIGRQDGRE